MKKSRMMKQWCTCNVVAVVIGGDVYSLAVMVLSAVAFVAHVVSIVVSYLVYYYHLVCYYCYYYYWFLDPFDR